MFCGRKDIKECGSWQWRTQAVRKDKRGEKKTFCCYCAHSSETSQSSTPSPGGLPGASRGRNILIFHLRLNLSLNITERERERGEVCWPGSVVSHTEFWSHNVSKLQSGWRFRGPERTINHLVTRTVASPGPLRIKELSQHLCTLQLEYEV